MAVDLPWEFSVCDDCLRRNPHAVWLVKYGCFGGHPTTKSRKVDVVVDKENMKLVKVRSPPNTLNDFNGRFYMCRHAGNCPRGDSCKFAHSEMELDKWNATKSVLALGAHSVPARPASNVCSACYTTNPSAVWLTWLPCSNERHTDKVSVVISNDRKRLLTVRNPPSATKNLSQLTWHADCRRACSSPHSVEERDYWIWCIVKRRMEELPPEVIYGDVSFREMFVKYCYPEDKAQLLQGTEELSCDNYKSKYHKLVYLDNLEHARKMVADCDGTYTLSYEKLRDGQCLVHVVGMPSTAMDYVAQNTPPCSVLVKTGERLIPGRFERKTDDSLLVSLELQRVQLKFPCKAFVHFEYNHWYFWRLHRAIDYASRGLIDRLVHARTSRYLPHSQRRAVNKQLSAVKIDSEYQGRALKKMLLCRPSSPFLLMGPFGTGKTHLLAIAITKLVLVGGNRGNKILVCTHQNKGADHICSTLLSQRIIDPKSVLRLYSDDRRGNTGLLQTMCISVQRDDIVARCLSQPVIVTTFMTALRLKEKDRQGHLHFTQIIIDEGAQSREPEVLGPLLMAGDNTSIIIAGDNKQVGPAVSVFCELARENGLGQSLLERLLDLYQSEYDKQQLNYHRHSLLTNYRCHPSILMLASSLSYECTLLSRSDSKPHPLAPYPIVFQCSSLEWEKVSDPLSTNEQEAKLLLKRVSEFIEGWSGTNTKPKVAILAGTAGQVDLLRRHSSRNPAVQLDITFTYTIQGSEFDAVFLSTHEPTGGDGKPLNTVRSICNEYVFNTVITRSRSLIFAVGNPFRLIKMSSHFSVNCWSELIQRCMTCQSFHLPPDQDAMATDLPGIVGMLTKQVLPMGLLEDTESPDDGSESDVVLTNYIDFLNKRPEYKRGIKLVGDPKQGGTRWQTDNEDEQEPSNVVLAELDLINHRKGSVKRPDAPAIPIVSNADRRCYFPLDKVAVDADTNEIVCGAEQERIFNETHFGRSILCRVNPRSMIEFMPLDKRYPILVNLPSLTKHERSGVVCFDPTSLNERLKVSNFIPREGALSMVFVVKVLRWKLNFPHPLGLTVGAIPCGDSIPSGDLLLKAAHHIPLAHPRPDASVRSVTLSKRKRNIFKEVITIDPEGSTDHDDALSCEHVSTGSNGEHNYRFGVHITDVQRFVPKDSSMDIEARQRACSVYSSPDCCVSKMLPEEVVQVTSILPDQTRDAFSVVAEVSVKDKKVVGEIHSVKVVKSKVTSSQATELTYESAQKLIFASKGSRLIKTLWIVACHLRQGRLGQSAAMHLKVHGEDEMSCPEAHMLVEELMVWANVHIARKLVSFPPVILRRQSPPNEERLTDLITTHSNLLALSPDLKQYVPDRQRDNSTVQVLHETVQAIERALREGHVRKALHLILFEHLHPQVAIAHALYRGICEPSSYCLPNGDSSHQHYGLRCTQYTRFTSPMRRYPDLVVQRILNSYLQNDRNPYSEEKEEMDAICSEVREREREVDKYETGRRSLVLGSALRQSSREYTCFVKKVEEGRLFNVFTDPSLKLGLDASAVHLKHLNAKTIPHRESSPKPGGDTPHTQCSVWQVKMASDTCKPNKFLSSPLLKHSSAGPEADIQLVFFPPEPTGSIEGSDLQETKINAFIKPFTQGIPGSSWRQLQSLALSPLPDAASVQALIPSRQAEPQSEFPAISSSPLWVYELRRPLQSCEVLRVQLTGSFNRSTQVVSPTVQLLEVGPNLRVCIQHNSAPTECFTDTALSKPPRQGHTSIHEYFLFWERTLLAEAATASLTDTELLILTDVKLVWPSLRRVTDSQGQVFYQLPPVAGDEPKDYCACLCLSKEFATSSYDFFNIHDGDLVCVRCYGNHRGEDVRGVLHMVVHSVDDVRENGGGIDVYLKFLGNKPNYISGKLRTSLRKLAYEVQLIPLSLPFRRTYNSLKKLSTLSPKALPSHITLRRVHHYDSLGDSLEKVLTKAHAKVATSLWRGGNKKQTLNKYQQQAVQLSCNHPFVMIQGPPGTGKSVTGAHIAYTLAMKLRKEVGKVRKKERELNPCVMYCGPSQQSVNVVLDILTSSAEVWGSGLKIVRVYSNAIESKDFSGPKFNPLVFREVKVDGQCEERVRDYALHHIIRERNQDIVDMDEEFKKLKENGKIPSAHKREQYSKTVTKESIAVLRDDVDIVLCTCNEAGSYRITNSVTPQYCIIDECAMATEPECMVALRRAKGVVLIGDDKQLQPVLLNKDAMKMGMGMSLFESYCRAGYSPHVLRIQYRMHQALCEFPSDQFYDGLLETDPSVEHKYQRKLDCLGGFWPQGRDFPMVFCDVVGEEEENHTGHRGSARVGLESKRNSREARKIVEIADVLVSRHGVSPEEIAVITPYSAQKEEVKRQLEREGVEGVIVKTITDSQGSEFGIVLLSTVRSLELSSLRTASGEKRKTDFGWRREHLGFITDRHQICVGITRCKYGLAIVGNKELLSHDQTWESLIQYYEEDGCVVSGEDFP